MDAGLSQWAGCALPAKSGVGFEGGPDELPPSVRLLIDRRRGGTDLLFARARPLGSPRRGSTTDERSDGAPQPDGKGRWRAAAPHAEARAVGSSSPRRDNAGGRLAVSDTASAEAGGRVGQPCRGGARRCGAVEVEARRRAQSREEEKRGETRRPSAMLRIVSERGSSFLLAPKPALSMLPWQRLIGRMRPSANTTPGSRRHRRKRFGRPLVRAAHFPLARPFPSLCVGRPHGQPSPRAFWCESSCRVSLHSAAGSNPALAATSCLWGHPYPCHGTGFPQSIQDHRPGFVLGRRPSLGGTTDDQSAPACKSSSEQRLRGRLGVGSAPRLGPPSRATARRPIVARCRLRHVQES